MLLQVTAGAAMLAVEMSWPAAQACLLKVCWQMDRHICALWWCPLQERVQ